MTKRSNSPDASEIDDQNKRICLDPQEDAALSSGIECSSKVEEEVTETVTATATCSSSDAVEAALTATEESTAIPAPSALHTVDDFSATTAWDVQPVTSSIETDTENNCAVEGTEETNDDISQSEPEPEPVDHTSNHSNQGYQSVNSDSRDSNLSRDKDACRSKDLKDEPDSPFEELFSTVMTATDEDGRSISQMFQLLPSKDDYPDYYKYIREPIDLKMIGTKIVSNAYATLIELEKDLMLMVKNAKYYNEPGSLVYKDANALRKIIGAKRADIESRKYQTLKSSERIRARRSIHPSGMKWSQYAASLKYDDTSVETEKGNSTLSEDDATNDGDNDSDPEDSDTNPMWQLIEYIRSITDDEGLVISNPFMRLPSKRYYPDYYQEIKNPVSLAQIQSRIKTNTYRSHQHLLDDLDTMYANAKKYNRPDSKIFENTCRLQKLTRAKALELFSGNKDEEEEEEEEEEEDDDDSIFDQSSKLDAIKNEDSKSQASDTDFSIKKGGLDDSLLNEESLDSTTLSLNSSNVPATGHSTSGLSVTIKKKITKRLVTGYIVFASEVRKSVVARNPDCNFGEVSRIIGQEWKNLPTETRGEYEKKAQRHNEETQRESAREAAEHGPFSPSSLKQVIQNAVYECHWEHKCDYQCEDTNDLLEHLTGEPNGHAWKSYADVKDQEKPIFQCLFYGCGRVKKGAAPFPSLVRLIRHIKEVHVTKQNPKSIPPEKRGRNFHYSKNNPRPYIPPPLDYGDDSIPPSPSTSVIGPDSNVYTCDWNWEHKCDFMCEDSNELLEHLTGEPNGHVWKTYADVKDKEDSVFQCLFSGCGRLKKGATPFPNITRLIKHIKDIHVTKQTPKPVNATRRISTYTPSKLSSSVTASSVSGTGPLNASLTVPNHVNPLPGSVVPSTAPVPTNSVGVQVEPVEPLFMKPVTPRIAHSSVYLQYIERLKTDQRHVSNWERQLNAKMDTTTPEPPARLPVACLANGPGVHSNVVEALWALRNFMFQDCVTLASASYNES